MWLSHPPRSKHHVTGRRSPPRTQQGSIIWPFPFRIDLFSWMMRKEIHSSFFAFREVCSCLCTNFPLLSVWLTLLIRSSCSSCCTLKNNLWESRESAADCSEHISGTEEWIDWAVTSGRMDRPFGWRSLWCSQKQKPVSSLDVCQRLQPGFIYFYGVCCCISLCIQPWIHFF